MATNKDASTKTSAIPGGSSSGATVRITVGFPESFTMPEKEQRAIVEKTIADVKLGRFTRANRHLIVAALMGAGYSDLAVDFVRELGQSIESLHREFIDACGLASEGKVKP